MVRLLFDGPQSGADLRRAMQKAGVEIDPPSFSRLMRRLEEEGPLAHLPREERRAILGRQTKREVRRIFKRFLGKRNAE